MCTLNDLMEDDNFDDSISWCLMDMSIQIDLEFIYLYLLLINGQNSNLQFMTIQMTMNCQYSILNTIAIDWPFDFIKLDPHPHSIGLNLPSLNSSSHLDYPCLLIQLDCLRTGQIALIEGL